MFYYSVFALPAILALFNYPFNQTNPASLSGPTSGLDRGLLIKGRHPYAISLLLCMLGMYLAMALIVYVAIYLWFWLHVLYHLLMLSWQMISLMASCFDQSWYCHRYYLLSIVLRYLGK